MRSVLAFSVLAIAAFSQAQDQYNIDPDSVSIGDRSMFTPPTVPSVRAGLTALQISGVSTKRPNALSSAFSSQV